MEKPEKKKAVFLDRDGTLIEDIPYLGDPEEVRLTPGSAVAIRMLNKRNFAVVIVTNQSGIARKLFTRNDLEEVHKKMVELIRQAGGKLDDILYCPHHPEFDVDCECRKPKAGLVFAAAEKLGIDLPRSYMIGDSPTDVLCGRNAGTKTILVRKNSRDDSSPSAGMISAEDLRPDHVASGLLEAVEWLLKEEK